MNDLLPETDGKPQPAAIKLSQDNQLGEVIPTSAPSVSTQNEDRKRSGHSRGARGDSLPSPLKPGSFMPLQEMESSKVLEPVLAPVPSSSPHRSTSGTIRAWV